MARGSDLAVWAELLRMLLSLLFFRLLSSFFFLNVCFANSLGFFFLCHLSRFVFSVYFVEEINGKNKQKKKKRK